MTQSGSARVISERIRAGASSAVQETEAALSRIEARNPAISAVRSVDVAAARRAAAEVDARISAGDRELPLAGVPVLVKDNVAQAGLPLFAGRRDGGGELAGADAEIVERLVRAGAVVVGRTSMDELAYGVTGTSAHAQVRNPRQVDRHPGGSSAGSAAAVAAGFVSIAIGTDTAGSIRIPAALCGVVGLRPTHGRVPSRGVAPLSPSFDCIGPIARHVSDVALVLSVLCDEPTLARAAHDEAVRTGDLRVAAIEGDFAVEISPAVLEAFRRAEDAIGRIVAATSRKRIPGLAHGPRASGPIIGAEAAHAWGSELAQFGDRFGEEVAKHLQRGAQIPAVRYLRAREEAAAIVRAVDAMFADHDVLALPTTATAATEASNPGPQLAFLALTVPFSLGGWPSVSLPMGVVDGLPVGVQLVGKRGDDARLLRLAHLLEELLPPSG